MRDLDQAKRVHAYFDGEAEPEERAAIEALLVKEPEAKATLVELDLLRRAVAASFDAEADKIPEARFEQIWDEIDRTLDRDARLQRAADVNVSLWSRIGAVLRPLWAPAAAAVGVAAAVAIFVSRSDGGDATGNTPPVVASKQVAAPPAVVAASAEDPVLGEAEIQRIEFGGRSGRIDRIEGERGVMTVIWVTEDDEQTDSERSL